MPEKSVQACMLSGVTLHKEDMKLPVGPGKFRRSLREAKLSAKSPTVERKIDSVKRLQFTA